MEKEVFEKYNGNAPISPVPMKINRGINIKSQQYGLHKLTFKSSRL